MCEHEIVHAIGLNHCGDMSAASQAVAPPARLGAELRVAPSGHISVPRVDAPPLSGVSDVVPLLGDAAAAVAQPGSAVAARKSARGRVPKKNAAEPDRGKKRPGVCSALGAWCAIVFARRVVLARVVVVWCAAPAPAAAAPLTDPAPSSLTDPAPSSFAGAPVAAVEGVDGAAKKMRKPRKKRLQVYSEASLDPTTPYAERAAWALPLAPAAAPAFYTDATDAAAGAGAGTAVDDGAVVPWFRAVDTVATPPRILAARVRLFVSQVCARVRVVVRVPARVYAYACARACVFTCLLWLWVSQVHAGARH